MNDIHEMMESLVYRAENELKAEWPRCRATFEWWILRDKYGVELSGTPRGPFEIEVFFDDRLGTKRGRWIAQVLPTKQRLPEKHKTYKLCFEHVRAQFREQSKKWAVVE